MLFSADNKAEGKQPLAKSNDFQWAGWPSVNKTDVHPRYFAALILYTHFLIYNSRPETATNRILHE